MAGEVTDTTAGLFGRLNGYEQWGGQLSRTRWSETYCTQIGA
jgi:hypothetical protein